MKGSHGYWKLMTTPVNVADDDCHQFLSLISNSMKWRGGTLPDKIGTVKLKQSVTLEPLSEHLVWGKLPASATISVGSTVIVEATQSKSRPRNVLVGRVIMPLWGDGWVPLKLINPSDQMLVLKRSSKVADVSPCIAVEELSAADGVCVNTRDVTIWKIWYLDYHDQIITVNDCGGCLWSVCCWWLVYSLTWPESDWLDSGWVGLHNCGAWEQSWHPG